MTFMFEWMRVADATQVSAVRVSAALVCCLLIAGCATQGSALCKVEPVMTIKTQGGSTEDIVALPLGDVKGATTRLFLREICNDGNEPQCALGQWRIGRVDINAAETQAPATDHAWRPKNYNKKSPFEPLGMSLLRDAKPGSATLFILDIAKPKAVRIWQLRILDGDIVDARLINVQDENAGSKLEGANDLQGVREGDNFSVYVTRFDFFGVLRRGVEGWPGVIQARDAAPLQPFADGLRGANGIIDPCPTCDLVVADYWGRRLHFLAKPGGEDQGFATGELSIRPDNLTLDGGRILIAGQRDIILTALNLLVPSWVPSPSGVYSIDLVALGADAKPQLLWEGGWRFGRSVSVAVPIPGGRLALGQILTPDILVVDCRPDSVNPTSQP